MPSHTHHITAICKLLRSCGYRHDLSQLFADCVETIAISLSNSVDCASRDQREKRYLEIIGRYERDVVEIFPKVFAEIVMAFEAGPADVLGEVYAELELYKKHSGQFFTPFYVCQFAAQATLGERDDILTLIERNGFVRTVEPACGSGAMVIAIADTMHAQDINYQRHLHATAIDIDPCAVHMAYIQLTLMHIPATVIVGNSLSREMYEHWYTPAHFLGGWGPKLRRQEAEDAARASRPQS